MIRFLCLTLLCLSPIATRLATGQQHGDATLFPPTTVAFAELTDPSQLVSLIFDHPLREKVESLPPYQMAINTPQYKQFLFGRTMVEGNLRMSWREALETLLANRVSVGFDAESEGIAVVFHGSDAESMKLFCDKLLEFAKLRENRDSIREGEYRGVPAFKIDSARVAAYEDRILIANNSKIGQKIIDRLLDGGPSLADNERFRTALAARDSDLAGWGFVDVEFVRNSGDANSLFEDQINNPVLEALVGGIQSSLGHSPYATLKLLADPSHLQLGFSMPFDAEWIPEEREYFFGPSGNGRGPELPTTNETLFTLSTYRDFSEIWLRAGDLFNEQINDGFAQADANLTTLFAGRDFGEDILGSFQPEVGFVATRQDFADVLPRPTIKLPAFAVVFQLKEPEKMTRELRRIFQSLVGFLNIVGAMNGQNQLEMDMESIGDHAQLVTSTYVPEPEDETSTNANIVYNFSPSVGFAGERFVISSSKALAKELTSAKDPSPANISDNTRANLSANVLRNVLADNREQLIAQNMLEDGNSREEAEAITDLLLQVVDYFKDASMSMKTEGNQLGVELNVRVEQ